MPRGVSPQRGNRVTWHTTVPAAPRMFDNQSILITGGTGSFGKAFLRTLLRQHRPHRLVVYSRDELKQYEMQQEFDHPAMRFFIGEVHDAPRLARAMSGIDYVVHAAALKHVPVAEYKPDEVHQDQRQLQLGVEPRAAGTDPQGA